LIGFTYDRHIYSTYANYNQKINKISMQVGARLEQYDIEGDFSKGAENFKVTDNIFSVYPSAFITYNPSEKNQFQVSYSRRVDRPSLGQINPIRQWSTPRVTSVGNPNLNPQFTNSYEFNYTRQIEKGSFTFGTFYRRVNDNISRILNEDPFDDDKVLLTFSNNDSNNRFGLEASTNYKFAKWWSANASADLYTQKESGIANGDQLEVTNTAFNARINNSFNATKNLTFQLFYMFQGGGKSFQFERRSMSMLNAGANLNVLKNKGTITFRVNDIFKGMRFKFETDRPFPSNGQFNWESRTAYIGFDYRFGGGKNQALRRKNRDNNETKGGGGFL
jgi:outer membrane receptor protein involved in Fe transport